jgi:membrane protein implicated in regulation of membrane protease activity
MIWLVRSLYFYNSIFSAFIDLVMTSMSLVVALWALTTSGSIFLSFWSFFLVQGLFVYIPKNFVRNKKTEGSQELHDDRFEYAHHAAEVAVAKLLKTH